MTHGLTINAHTIKEVYTTLTEILNALKTIDMGMVYNKKDNELVKLSEYNSEVNAYIAKAALEQAGIECSIDNAIFAQLFPGNPAFGGITIVVKQRDYDRAKQVVDSLEFSDSEL